MSEERTERDPAVRGQHPRVAEAREASGDRVTVGVSPYDLKRGLITYRAK